MAGETKVFAHETSRKLSERHPGDPGLAKLLVTFIGASKLAGGRGGILPMLGGIRPWSTPIAAAALALDILLALGHHLQHNDPVGKMIPSLVLRPSRCSSRGVSELPMDDRLDHLQQSVDAVAIEVGRIGEAQRFSTKLHAEGPIRGSEGGRPASYASSSTIVNIRVATMADVPVLEQLITASVRGLNAGRYTQAEMDAALAGVFGVDTQLIADGTYVMHSRLLRASRLVATRARASAMRGV